MPERGFSEVSRSVVIALLRWWSAYDHGSLDGVPAAATKDQGEGGNPIGQEQHLVCTQIPVRPAMETVYKVDLFSFFSIPVVDFRVP